MRKLILLSLLLCAVPTHAQTQTTVTGTVLTPTGTLATSGTVVFTLSPASGSTLYYVQGLNVLVTSGKCGINASGVIQNLALSGACLVWGNDVITPGNTTYTVQFNPNGLTGMTIRQLLISGSTWSFSTPKFAPQVQINPQYQTILTSPIQTNLVPVADGVFNVGQAGLRYGSGYFTNINVSNSFAFGNLTVLGTSLFNGLGTFNAGLTGTGSIGTLTAGSGILSTPNVWTAQQTFQATTLTQDVLPRTAGTYQLGSIAAPYIQLTLGFAGNYAHLASLSTGVNIAYLPNLSGTIALSNVGQGWSGNQTGMTIVTSTVDSTPVGATTPSTGAFTTAAATTSYSLNGKLLISVTSPTVLAAGCGGSAAAIANPNGTAAFQVNVGTSNTGVCTVTMPAAPHGWMCSAEDQTTISANVARSRCVTGGTTSITLANYTDIAGAHAWVDSDVLGVTAVPY